MKVETSVMICFYNVDSEEGVEGFKNVPFYRPALRSMYLGTYLMDE